MTTTDGFPARRSPEERHDLLMRAADLEDEAVAWLREVDAATIAAHPDVASALAAAATACATTARALRLSASQVSDGSFVVRAAASFA